MATFKSVKATREHGGFDRVGDGFLKRGEKAGGLNKKK